MFKSIFFKLYIVLFIASIVIGALAFAAIYSIQYVNQAQHVEQISAAPLQLIKSAVQDNTQLLETGRMPNLPGMTLATIPLEQLDVESGTEERLKQGFSYYKFSQDGQLIAYIKLDTFEDELLKVTLQNPSYTLTHALPKLVTTYIQRSKDFEQGLSELKAITPYKITETPLANNNENFSDISSYRVCSTEFCDNSSLFVHIPSHGKNLVVGPIAIEAKFPLLPTATIVIMAFTALGLILFQQIKTINGQFRKIEHAAYKISRGDLDTRIEPKDQKELGQMAEAFNIMAEHIQRLLTIQREMIRAVSHELRTPVARIRFGVQMIEDFAQDDSMQSQLAAIDNDIQELDDLIDEILTYARLEEGGPIIEFQHLNLEDIVEQVCTEQQSLTSNDVNIDYEFSCDTDDPLSEFEERYIHRAIQNLVGNARRYANSRVKVICHLTKDTCRVDVEDDGPGIPEKDWDRVFTPFARLDDSRTRASGGYGLGLSIVRRITYWHGGKSLISRSKSLDGAKFSLIWPREQP